MTLESKAQSFSRVAESYERARPDYPHAAVMWLAEQLRLGPESVVLDLGAGTGKLTRQLVPYSGTVVAVEPLPQMAARLKEKVPGVRVLSATAEAMPLPSGFADAATAGQSFHWFAKPEALSEIHRVLRPGGWLGLIWNRRQEDDPLWDEIDELSAPYRGEDRGDLGWREPLAQSGLFGAIRSQSFFHQQTVTPEGLAERMLSTSYLAGLKTRLREELRDELLEIARRHQERPGSPLLLRYHADAFACASC